MKNVLAIGAFVALAGVAHAHPGGGSLVQRVSGVDMSAYTGMTTMSFRIDNTYNISGYNSWDLFGDASNEGFTSNLGAGAHITGIGWDTLLTTTSAGTLGGSWASEATIGFLSTSGNGVFLNPYFDVPNPVVNASSSSAVVDLVGLGLDFLLDGDGVLTVVFFESFDDADNEIDAHWLADSSITVQYIPTPGALALLGLGGLAAGRRRR